MWCWCCSWVRVCHFAQHPRSPTTASQCFTLVFGLDIPNHTFSNPCLLCLAVICFVYTKPGMPFSTSSLKIPSLKSGWRFTSASSVSPVIWSWKAANKVHKALPAGYAFWIWLAVSTLGLLKSTGMPVPVLCYLLVTPLNRTDLVSSSLLGPSSLSFILTLTLADLLQLSLSTWAYLASWYS